MQVSKSDYMLYLRHPAWLWLKRHDKEKLPPTDESTQAMFDAGFVFESYAEKLFSNTIKVEYDHSSYQGYKDLIPKTKEAIESKAKTILQGRFEAGEITCICDVLVKVKKGTFDLYEIKSSTSVKPEHFWDLAFQVEVLNNAGWKIEKIFVVHVNNEYIRKGEVTANELTKVTEVTGKVKSLQDYTKENIVNALEVVRQKECPDISPAHCKVGLFGEWLSIYKTIADLSEYSIYDLCSLKAGMIRELEALGVTKLQEIPDDFLLTHKQRSQIQATKDDEVIIKEKLIKKFLSKLEYSLYFLDYETLSSVVPYFDGLGPYRQLPFQYSLHILNEPNGELVHFEYLHQNNSNPVKPLSKTLKSQIGNSGSIFVWFEGFEKSCNKLMGDISKEYKEFYEDVNKRIVDLMTPFSTGSYVHKDFFGSASIKKVLPVLIPELSYKDLNIHEGGAAQRLWMEVVLDEKRANDKNQILKDLKEYCKLDTFAMVRIYQHLVDIVNRSEDKSVNTCLKI